MNVTRPRRRFHPVALILVLLVLGLLMGVAIYRYNRPLPALHVSMVKPKATAQTVSLPWIQSGESAISTTENKVLGQGPNANQPVATASIAKLITILTVLKKYPLSAGQSGPTITLTQADVDLYNKYYAEDGSNIPVELGEKLTEYQMIQAMMLPSANNIADSLAIWAYGSMSAYQAAAVDEVTHLGMASTKIGSDASGFLPNTTSTANDLVLLGEAAMKQPVIVQIAQQPQATLPVVGTVYSTNSLLGVDDITGLKTGTSDQAGDCYLFTADHTFSNLQKEQFVGVVMGAPSDLSRFQAAKDLLEATYSHYKEVIVAKAGEPIGTITSAWGSKTSVAPTSDVDEFAWEGDAPAADATVSLQGKTTLDYNQLVGSVAAGSSRVPLYTTAALNGPSIWWRIFHS